MPLTSPDIKIGSNTPTTDQKQSSGQPIPTIFFATPGSVDGDKKSDQSETLFTNFAGFYQLVCKRNLDQIIGQYFRLSVVKDKVLDLVASLADEKSSVANKVGARGKDLLQQLAVILKDPLKQKVLYFFCDPRECYTEYVNSEQRAAIMKASLFLDYLLKTKPNFDDFRTAIITQANAYHDVDNSNSISHRYLFAALDAEADRITSNIPLKLTGDLDETTWRPQRTETGGVLTNNVGRTIAYAARTFYDRFFSSSRYSHYLSHIDLYPVLTNCTAFEYLKYGQDNTVRAKVKAKLASQYEQFMENHTHLTEKILVLDGWVELKLISPERKGSMFEDMADRHQIQYTLDVVVQHRLQLFIDQNKDGHLFLTENMLRKKEQELIKDALNQGLTLGLITSDRAQAYANAKEVDLSSSTTPTPRN